MMKPRKGWKTLAYYRGYRQVPKPGQNAPNGDPIVSLHHHCKAHDVDFLLTYKWHKSEGLYLPIGHTPIEPATASNGTPKRPVTPNVPQAQPVDTIHLLFTCPYCGLSDQENFVVSCWCGREVCSGSRSRNFSCGCGYRVKMPLNWAKPTPRETLARSGPVPRDELASKMVAGARARAGLSASIPRSGGKQ